MRKETVRTSLRAGHIFLAEVQEKLPVRGLLERAGVGIISVANVDQRRKGVKKKQSICSIQLGVSMVLRTP